MARSKEDTIKAVKELAAVVNDDAFHKVLADLADAEDKALPDLDRAMNDPKGELERQGVKLPANATVKITKNSPIGIQICRNGDCVTWQIKVF